MKYLFSDEVFFILDKGSFILWNCSTHSQYLIRNEHIARIMEFVNSKSILIENDLDQEFLDAGLIVEQTDIQQDSSWKWDRLSRIFHVGTSRAETENEFLNIENIEINTYEQYADYCESISGTYPSRIKETFGPLNKLPAPDLTELSKVKLIESLENRKTSRDFDDSSPPIFLNEVADLLHITLGAVHGSDRDDFKELGIESYGYRRTSPSAGGVQALDGYLIAIDVENLPMGVYQYHEENHSLSEVAPFNKGQLGPLLCHQNFASDMSFAIVFVARFERLWWKYPHSRAYRTVYLDAGHLSQTFLLSATALGLNTWLTGYFFDNALASLLQLNNENEAPIFIVGAGHGEGSPLSKEQYEVLKKRMA